VIDGLGDRARSRCTRDPKQQLRDRNGRRALGQETSLPEVDRAAWFPAAEALRKINKGASPLDHPGPEDLGHSATGRKYHKIK
jgi:hypothetical protein